MLAADGYCTQIFVSGQEPVLSSRNLKYFEEILNDRTFMRVHHSYLINLDHVKGYTHQEEIILADKLHCPLSRAHKKHFIEHYKIRKS
jgi:two-component system LytT family response regulator